MKREEIIEKIVGQRIPFGNCSATDIAEMIADYHELVTKPAVAPEPPHVDIPTDMRNMPLYPEFNFRMPQLKERPVIPDGEYLVKTKVSGQWFGCRRIGGRWKRLHDGKNLITKVLEYRVFREYPASATKPEDKPVEAPVPGKSAEEVAAEKYVCVSTLPGCDFFITSGKVGFHFRCPAGWDIEKEIIDFTIVEILRDFTASERDRHAKDIAALQRENKRLVREYGFSASLAIELQKQLDLIQRAAIELNMLGALNCQIDLIRQTGK